MEERIRQIMVDILEVNDGDIDADFGPAQAPLWDSLNNLKLITAIEEEFGIKLSMDEINEMTDLGMIKNVLSRHIQG